MRNLFTILHIAAVLSNPQLMVVYQQGAYQQWCKDQGSYYDGGIWSEQKRTCFCYTAYGPHEMDATKLPYEQPKYEDHGDTYGTTGEASFPSAY